MGQKKTLVLEMGRTGEKLRGEDRVFSLFVSKAGFSPSQKKWMERENVRCVLCILEI